MWTKLSRFGAGRFPSTQISIMSSRMEERVASPHTFLSPIVPSFVPNVGQLTNVGGDVALVEVARCVRGLGVMAYAESSGRTMLCPGKRA